MQTGGKLYDEGVYGCIFVPPLLCKGDVSKQYKDVPVKEGIVISKVLDEEDALYEYYISKLIRSIPLNKNYFLPSDSICEPKKIEDQVDPDIRKCKLFEKESINNLRVLHMKYGGTPLVLYSFNVATFDFIQFSRHLLEGVALMNLYGLVHRDLHQKNIIIDNAQVPRIIDFNLTINVKNKITSKQLRHSHNIGVFHEPPDSTLVNAIALGHKPQNIIESILTKKSIIRTIQAVLGITIDDMRESLNDFYNKSVSAQSGDELKWFQTYWRKIDSWAIGANLVQLISKLLLWPDFQKQWRKLSTTIVPILKGLCNVNPVYRIDAIQALYKLDPQNYIIQKYAKEWINKVGTGF
jgi:serine/threonine protein kinase